MALGSILVRPDDLESSLNYEAGIKRFLANEKFDETDVIQRIIHANFTEDFSGRLKALLPAISPVFSIGGGVEGKVYHDSGVTLQAMDIHAEVLHRDAAKDHINEALQTPDVDQYVKKGLFARPLYMIIGVASCKKLLMSSTKTREIVFSADLEAEAAITGAEAGAGLSTDKKASAGTDMEIQEDCDFAYRVRKFQYSRLRGVITDAKDVTDGAMFGKDFDRGEVPLTSAEAEEMYDEVAVFDEFDSDDDDIDSPNGVIMFP